MQNIFSITFIFSVYYTTPLPVLSLNSILLVCHLWRNSEQSMSVGHPLTASSQRSIGQHKMYFSITFVQTKHSFLYFVVFKTCLLVHKWRITWVWGTSNSWWVHLSSMERTRTTPTTWPNQDFLVWMSSRILWQRYSVPGCLMTSYTICS